MRAHPSVVLWFGYATGLVVTGVGWAEGRPVAGLVGFLALSVVLLALRTQEAVLCSRLRGGDR